MKATIIINTEAHSRSIAAHLGKHEPESLVPIIEGLRDRGAAL